MVYNMSMDTKGLKVGDRCTLRLDWGDGSHKGKRVQILSFQQHGKEVFAKVLWCTVQARALEAQYDNVFNVDELKKVSK